MRIIIKNQNGYYMIYKKWESGYETPFSLRKFKNLVEWLKMYLKTYKREMIKNGRKSN